MTGPPPLPIVFDMYKSYFYIWYLNKYFVGNIF